jgi:uncharacterized protein
MKIQATALCALALVTALAGCESYVDMIDTWHAARIERLQAEDGWLTLVGLHPLADGANAVGSAPDADVRLAGDAPAQAGVIEVGPAGPVFTAHAKSGVLVNGESVPSAPLLTDLQDDTTMLTVGTLSFYVIDRDGALYVRVKDSDSTVRREFTGVDRYPVDDYWRIEARLLPHDPPRGVMVPNALGNVTEEPSPGRLIFSLQGKTRTLTPTGKPGSGLFIVFADYSSGTETYGGGRFLSAEPPDEDGNVILDFNKAVNPPCAFTPYAICPLPPEGNTLDVMVEAGEKIWGEH